MSPALPALLTNVAIVAGAVAAVWITENPLALFVLLLLKELPVVVPYARHAQGEEDEDDEGGPPMGFIH